MKQYTMKELRLINELTQEKLAEKTGFSKDYISLIERGKRNPSDKAKAIFADTYNVPIVQIFLAVQSTKSALKKKEEK